MENGRYIGYNPEDYRRPKEDTADFLEAQSEPFRDEYTLHVEEMGEEGSIVVKLPNPDYDRYLSLVKHIPDLAEHAKKNGWANRYFNMGIVHMNWEPVLEARRSVVEDNDWKMFKEEAGSNLHIASEDQPHEDMIFTNGLIVSLSDLVLKQQKLTEKGLTNSQEYQDNINLYLHAIQYLSSRTIEYADETFNGSVAVFPLRTSALMGEQVLKNLEKHDAKGLALPIRTSRFSGGTDDNPTFSVGITSDQDDHLENIFTDFQKYIHGKRVRIYEVTVASGLTCLSILAYWKSLGIIPAAVESVAPVVSRQGAINTVRGARSMGIDLKFTALYATPLLGDTWGSSGDSILTYNAEMKKNVEVIGDASQVVGVMKLKEKIGRVVGAAEDRWNIDTSH